MNALMAEVLEGHLREHVVPARALSSDGAAVMEDLIDVARAYLK
jgi:DNA-binding FrmR family transcriptional regulator